MRREVTESAVGWRRRSAKSINFYGFPRTDAEIRISVFVVSGWLRGRNGGINLLVTTNHQAALDFCAGRSGQPSLSDHLNWEWSVGGTWWHRGETRGWKITKHSLLRIHFWPLMLMTLPGMASIIMGLLLD